MDILIGENLSSIELANMDLNYWSFCLSSRKGGVGVMDLELSIIILANWCNIQVIIH